MNRKNIPFDFVFDHLLQLEVTVKPMFGMFAIYVGEKIMLILRQRKNYQDTNGIWIATNKEYHESLKKDLPSLCSISTYTNNAFETEWQILQADSNDFETSVIKVCEFIVHSDHRIGKIPKPRQYKRANKLDR
jgi:hypothetical protein